jgi:hypothetical protein
VRQSFAKRIFDAVNPLTQRFQLAREAFDLKPSTASNFMKQLSGGAGSWGLEVRGEPELGLNTPLLKRTRAVDIDLIGREYGRCRARMQVSRGRADLYAFGCQFEQKVSKI